MKAVQNLAREIQQAGGIITVDDLRSAQPRFRTAIQSKVSLLLVFESHDSDSLSTSISMLAN